MLELKMASKLHFRESERLKANYDFIFDLYIQNVFFSILQVQVSSS